MSQKPRNSAPKPRGRPFQKGNPGRPKGTRHKITLAAETLLDGEAEKLTRKCTDLALEGNAIALRLCMERICPPRKDRAVSISLPALETATDAVCAMGTITQAMTQGDITLSEAQQAAAVVETFRRTLETEDLERRVAALERDA